MLSNQITLGPYCVRTRCSMVPRKPPSIELLLFYPTFRVNKVFRGITPYTPAVFKLLSRKPILFYFNRVQQRKYVARLRIPLVTDIDCNTRLLTTLNWSNSNNNTPKLMAESRKLPPTKYQTNMGITTSTFMQLDSSNLMTSDRFTSLFKDQQSKINQFATIN